MKIILKGITRIVTISTENQDLMGDFIEWLNEHHRYISHDLVNNNSVYTFVNDNPVSTSAIKARKIGLLTSE